MVWRCLRHTACCGAVGFGLAWDVKNLGRTAQLMLRMRRGKSGSDIKKLLSFGAEISAVSELDLTFHRGPGLREGHFPEKTLKIWSKKACVCCIGSVLAGSIERKASWSSWCALDAPSLCCGEVGEASCPWDGLPQPHLLAEISRAVDTVHIWRGCSAPEEHPCSQDHCGVTGRVWGATGPLQPCPLAEPPCLSSPLSSFQHHSQRGFVLQHIWATQGFAAIQATPRPRCP